MIRTWGDLTLLIDGVIFQLHQGRSGGISNVWKTLLEDLAADNRFKKIMILDRGGVPKHPDFEMIPFEPFSEEKFMEDSARLDQICMEKNVTVFISTYFTTPRNTYSIAYIHDFIPEKTGMNLNLTPWLNKARVLEWAHGYIGVSVTTLDDLRTLHPKYDSKKRSLVYNSISGDFTQYPKEEVTEARRKYNIHKKYFLVLGQRLAYKNVLAFFKAFALLENRDDFQIVCVGGYHRLEYVLQFGVDPFKDISVLTVDNRELSLLLNEAEALVYPSIYEGFGMPILEAMASHCPVIIAKQASACIEVAGVSACAIDGHDVGDMVKALKRVQEPEVRASLIEKGKANAARFSRDKTLHQFYKAIAHNLADISAFYEAKK